MPWPSLPDRPVVESVGDAAEEAGEEIEERPRNRDRCDELQPRGGMEPEPGPLPAPPFRRRRPEAGGADELAAVLGDAFGAEEAAARGAAHGGGPPAVDRAEGFGK